MVVRHPTRNGQEAGAHGTGRVENRSGRRAFRGVRRNPHPHPVRLRGGGPGSGRRPRRPRQHRLGLGPRRHPRGVCGRPDQRRPPQSGGHSRSGSLQGLRLAQGRPVRPRADRRSVRRGAPGALELLGSPGQGRPRPHHQDPGRVLHPPRQRRPAGQRTGRSARPDHRHRDPAVRHLRRHRPAEHPAGRQPRPADHRPARRRHRHGLGHGRGIRHQPGPRLRPTPRQLPHRIRQRLAGPVRQSSTSGSPSSGH